MKRKNIQKHPRRPTIAKNELDRWLEENGQFVVPKDEEPEGEEKRKDSFPREHIPELDLHGLTAEKAVARMINFFLAQGPEVKKIRIIHGKGRHSGEKGPVLQKEIRNWLSCQRKKQMVKDFRYETAENGGQGATLVLLLH